MHLYCKTVEEAGAKASRPAKATAVLLRYLAGLRVTELLLWLQRVQKQLVITIPKRKRDISALEEEGRWVKAQDPVGRLPRL